MVQRIGSGPGKWRKHMSAEVLYLIWSAALGFVYLNVQAMLFRKQVGIEKANGVRDDDPEPDVMTARGERALKNFLETYPFFVALVAAVAITNGGDALTFWGATLYFWGRLIYLPLYIFGISPARSIVWSIATLGLIVLFFGAIF